LPEQNSGHTVPPGDGRTPRLAPMTSAPQDTLLPASKTEFPVNYSFQRTRRHDRISSPQNARE